MMELTLGYRVDGQAITTAGAENPHIFIDGISGSGKSFAKVQILYTMYCRIEKDSERGSKTINAYCIIRCNDD